MTGVFTLDSILALVVALGMITTSLYLVSLPTVSDDEYTYQVSLDVLAVAEKKDYLENAVNGDPTGIDSLKLTISDHICFELEIADETGNLVFYDNTGCSETDRHYIGKRSFISNSSFYISTLKVWYR